MKPPLDALGNVLAKDQIVGVKLGDQFLRAKITAFKDAGLLVAGAKGNPQLTPGSMTLTITVIIQFTDGAQVSEIYRLVDPEYQKQMEDFINQERNGQTA